MGPLSPSLSLSPSPSPSLLSLSLSLSLSLTHSLSHSLTLTLSSPLLALHPSTPPPFPSFPPPSVLTSLTPPLGPPLSPPGPGPGRASPRNHVWRAARARRLGCAGASGEPDAGPARDCSMCLRDTAGGHTPSRGAGPRRLPGPGGIPGRGSSLAGAAAAHWQGPAGADSNGQDECEQTRLPARSLTRPGSLSETRSRPPGPGETGPPTAANFNLNSVRVTVTGKLQCQSHESSVLGSDSEVRRVGIRRCCLPVVTENSDLKISGPAGISQRA